MKRESGYRKDMDTLQAMVDEVNKKKKWLFQFMYYINFIYFIYFIHVVSKYSKILWKKVKS